MTRRNAGSKAQLQMFTTEDLPLFSGTAQRGKVERFSPKEAIGTQALLAMCPICLDTGAVRTLIMKPLRYCNCQAGQDAMRDWYAGVGR